MSDRSRHGGQTSLDELRPAWPAATQGCARVAGEGTKRSRLGRPESWVYLAGLPAGLAVVLTCLMLLAPRVMDFLSLPHFLLVLLLLLAAVGGCLGVAGLKWWNSRRPV